MEGNMSATTGLNAPSRENIEQLRVILERRFGVAVSFVEAEEVGVQLISLYECLARERDNVEKAGDGSTS
jgi:hypothetical protein